MTRNTFSTVRHSEQHNTMLLKPTIQRVVWQVFVVSLVILAGIASRQANAQVPFTYNGKIGTSTGSYDFQFKLFTGSTGGSQVGSTIVKTSVSVSAGNYSVALDFGDFSFAKAPLYMSIQYRVHGTTTYTTVATRVLETTQFSLQSDISQALVLPYADTGVGSGDVPLVSLTNIGDSTGLQVTAKANGIMGITTNAGNGGVYGRNTATNIYAWLGYSTYGVYAKAEGLGGNGIGVYGESVTNRGVFGLSVSSIGVRGESQNVGVSGAGTGTNSVGVTGRSDGDNAVGVYGVAGTGVNNLAGRFGGKVQVDGNLAVSADVNFGSNLTVTENVTAHGFTSTSDARFKDHITSLSGALDKVMALRGVTYDWKQKEFPDRRFDSAKHVGFIAQEMEAVLPELVSKDKDGYRSVNYMGAIPVLVEAIKEQQKAITEQQKEIDALKKEKGKDKGYFASGLLIPEAGALPWIAVVSVIGLGMGRLRRKS